jgi:hypothetical protein
MGETVHGQCPLDGACGDDATKLSPGLTIRSCAKPAPSPAK